MEGSVLIHKIPREEAVEGIFEKILASPSACSRLFETMAQHISQDDEIANSNPQLFAKILFSAYETQDISALLLELCQRSMFDLLREAFLIPKRFHGKSGKNPVILTTADGELTADAESLVPRHEWKKFQEVWKAHSLAARSSLYLADGYDISRSYQENMEIEETRCNRRRGVLILYALPDTAQLGLTEAQAYARFFDVFSKIQQEIPNAMVYYGQETGEKQTQTYDEAGVLLPIHQFEHNMLKHLDLLDGLLLSYREEQLSQAGNDLLEYAQRYSGAVSE